MNRRMNGRGLPLWISGAGVVFALLCSGCSSPRSTSGPEANLIGSSAGEPVFFSDEFSMSQVKETKELLALRTQDYVVGPDDVLDVSIFEWESNEQTKILQLRVSETGVISLPAVGSVQVAGKSVQEIQRMIEDELVSKNVLQTPRVGVWVSEFRSRQISVIGAVNAPGVYAIHQNVSTLLSMLTLAGGPQENAGGVAYVIRRAQAGETPVRMRIDLDELLEQGKAELNPVLCAGDVVYVPKAPLIYVYGEVRQAGAFTFRKQLRVLESIALAGGFAENADRSSVILIRRSPAGEDSMSRLNITRIEHGEEPNIYLRDGDVLRVRTSGPKRMVSQVLDFVRGIFTFSYRVN